jgi:hypothetical protein
VVESIVKLGQVEPSFVQLGSDIIAQNMAGPEMGVMAERLREQLLLNGSIPRSQMTEAEAAAADQRAQAAAQQPDPLMIAAQAEQGKAEAQTNKVNVDAQVASANLTLKQQNQQHKQMMDAFKAQQDRADSDAKRIGELADAVKTLREGFGVDTIFGPEAVAAFARQVQLVMKEQQHVALAPPTQN